VSARAVRGGITDFFFLCDAFPCFTTAGLQSLWPSSHHGDIPAFHPAAKDRSGSSRSGRKGSGQPQLLGPRAPPQQPLALRCAASAAGPGARQLSAESRSCCFTQRCRGQARVIRSCFGLASTPPWICSRPGIHLHTISPAPLTGTFAEAER